MRLLPFLLGLIFSGCATVVNYAALPDVDGKTAFTFTTVFGFLGGTEDDARVAAKHEARRLCGGDFVRTRERIIERETMWQAKNGQLDLVWEIRCTS